MAEVPPTFEIRVAAIGHVSVGKTTLLNAIFREKFSEVSMRRTTAGVNFFRICTRGPATNAPTTSSSSTRPMMMAEEPRKAASTLLEIMEANERLRNSSVTEEIEFNIEIQESICDMRDDTTLVFVDIPGVNEADVEHKYIDYVNQNWKTFDCVMLVMDARQGVNTTEQMELLRLVKTNLDNQRKVPVMIVFNKIDDPDDLEQQALLQESRQTVERIFEVSDRSEALRNVVDGTLEPSSPDFSPIFLPLSAERAFIFRSASLLTIDQFESQFDAELLEKLGRDAFGRAWKSYSQEERVQSAFTLVSDPRKYREGVEASNFHNFLTAFRRCVSGDANQRRCFEEQVQVACALIGTLGADDVQEIKRIHSITTCLNINPTDRALFDLFWRFHAQEVDTAFNNFTSANEARVLAKPMQMILDFTEFLKEVGKIHQEKEHIVSAAKQICLRQIAIVLDRPRWANHEYNPHDWARIYGSLLSVPLLGECFGMAWIYLDRAFQNACRMEEHTEFAVKLQGQALELVHPNDVHVQVPEDPSFPDHLGHVLWQFCRLKTMLDLFLWNVRQEKEGQAQWLQQERNTLHRQLRISDATNHVMAGVRDDFTRQACIEVAKDKILESRPPVRMAGTAQQTQEARTISSFEKQGIDDNDVPKKTATDTSSPSGPAWAQVMIVKPDTARLQSQARLWGIITVLGVAFPQECIGRVTWLVCVVQLTFHDMPQEELEAGGLGVNFCGGGSSGGHRKTSFLLGLTTWIFGSIVIYGSMPAWAQGQWWTGSLVLSIQNLLYFIVSCYLQLYKG